MSDFMTESDQAKEYFSDHWNCFLVKALRQVGHSNSIFWLLGILVVLQLGLLLLSDSNTVWGNYMPIGLIGLLAFCGFGSMLCLLAAHHSGVFRSLDRAGYWHFYDLTPIRPGRVLAFLVLGYSGFFLAALLTSLISLSVLIGSRPDRWGEVLLAVVIAYAAPLGVALLGEQRFTRPEAILPLFAFFLLPKLYGDELLSLPLCLIGVAALLGYSLLCEYGELLPLAAEREQFMRWGQLGLLLLMPLYPISEYSFGLALGLLALVSSVMSLGGSLAPVSVRVRRSIPVSRWGRIYAFLFFGASSGGWFWSFFLAAIFGWFCLWRQAADVWFFLLVWSLLSGGIGIIVSRLSVRWKKGNRHHMNRSMAYHQMVFGVLLFGFIGLHIAALMWEVRAEQLYRPAAALLLPFLPLLLLSQWRSLIAAGRLFLSSRPEEAA